MRKIENVMYEHGVDHIASVFGVSQEKYVELYDATFTALLSCDDVGQMHKWMKKFGYDELPEPEMNVVIYVTGVYKGMSMVGEIIQNEGGRGMNAFMQRALANAKKVCDKNNVEYAPPLLKQMNTFGIHRAKKDDPLERNINPFKKKDFDLPKT